MSGKYLTILAIIVILGAACGVYLISAIPTNAPDPATSPSDNPEWVLSSPSPQGTAFEYPSPFPATYLSPQEWPPVVTLEGGEYSCAEEQQRMIEDREYCVVETSEGAAGSVYHSYEYIVSQGDFVARVRFTLRVPQCMNYDEPEQSACKAEQASFDIDGLADRIAQSIRMQ